MSHRICMVCGEKCKFWEDQIYLKDRDVAAHYGCLRYYLLTLIALNKLPSPDEIAEEAMLKYFPDEVNS